MQPRAVRDVLGHLRRDPGSDWVPATFRLTGALLRVRAWAAPTAPTLPAREIPLVEIGELVELGTPAAATHVEVVLVSGDRFEAVLPVELVAELCDQLRATVAVEHDPTPPEGPTDGDRSGPTDRQQGRGRRRPVRRALAAMFVVTACVGAVTAWQANELAPAAPRSGPSTSRVADLDPATPTTASPQATTTTTAPPTTTTAPPPPPPPPEPLVLAPLTGLPAPKSAVERPAIVSKIDGSAPAMPQVGMELADVVLEVRIEYGYSRYLAVWHSRDPAVIGPHRSARTTDPNLLSIFGKPLFAYSGANAKVLDVLAMVPWKTDAAPGAIPDAYFRDLQRPFPHNLLARPGVLRSRSEGPAPTPLFWHRPAGSPAPGLPVGSVVTAAGPPVQWTWDGALNGWRRRIHGMDHVHANGQPVAPQNVVVVETPYVTSFADDRSPEALSVGSGRAWVFSEGRVVAGTWRRDRNTDPWDLRDPLGTPLTLSPGQTWVVLADDEPVLGP